MRHSLHLQAPAEADLIEAAKWYEERQVGLGRIFIEEIEALFVRIAVFPEGSVVVEDPIRRARHPHFPYSVYYFSDSGRIEVIAVLHAARAPARWKARRPNR